MAASEMTRLICIEIPADGPVLFLYMPLCRICRAAGREADGAVFSRTEPVSTVFARGSVYLILTAEKHKEEHCIGLPQRKHGRNPARARRRPRHRADRRNGGRAACAVLEDVAVCIQPADHKAGDDIIDHMRLLLPSENGSLP